MENREQLIADLETSKRFILKIKAMNQQIKEDETQLRIYEGCYNSAKNAEFSWGMTILIAIGIFIVSVIAIGIIEIILEVVCKIMPFYAMLRSKIFYVIYGIISVIISFIYNKKSTESTKSSEETFKSMYESGITKHNKLLVELNEMMCSPAGELAKSLIPPDYFYPTAIDKFIYFIKNGHADNMKEAIKEYDEHLHRQVLEEEARKATANSEVAAAAAVTSAQKSKEIAEKQETIEFWTMYNAYLTEKIINKH